MTESDSPEYAMFNCHGPIESYPHIELLVSDRVLTLYPHDYIYYCTT